MASLTFTHTPQETCSDILRSEVRDVYQSGRGVDTLQPRSLIVLMTRPLPIPRPFRVHFLPWRTGQATCVKRGGTQDWMCECDSSRYKNSSAVTFSHGQLCTRRSADGVVIFVQFCTDPLNSQTRKRLSEQWGEKRPISGCVLQGEQRGGRRLTNRAFLKLRILKIDHLNTVYNKMVNGSFKTGAFTGDTVVFVPVVFLFW